MTREEANNIARGITDKIEATTDIDDWAEFWGFTRDDYEEFLEMPIKALEQEPCEDYISRQAVIDAIEDDNRNGNYSCFASNNDAECFKDVIRSLSSVTPKPKTDVLDKIKAEIQGLRNCSCNCSDGIIDDVEDIIDKYTAESEDKE